MSDFLDCYSERLLSAIDGRRVIYVSNDLSGNYGDRLIDVGTVAWLQRYVANFERVPESRIAKRRMRRNEGVTLLFGSGSVGALCQDVHKRRTAILRYLPGPAILLPSTVFDGRENLSAFEIVFVRDHVSAALLRDVCPATMMPCMAEWAQLPDVPITSGPRVFLRHDNAAPAWTPSDACDPIEVCGSLQDYCDLAGSCSAVTTNRLHFAIAARIHGRSVTMLPTNWHKVRAYWETWYKDLGSVAWSDRVR